MWKRGCNSQTHESQLFQTQKIGIKFFWSHAVHQYWYAGHESPMGQGIKTKDKKKNKNKNNFIWHRI